MSLQRGITFGIVTVINFQSKTIIRREQWGGLVFSSVLGGHLPVHNEDMETTIEGIYIAGDASGVEEASTAMEKGKLAGIDMARKLGCLSEGEATRRSDVVRQSLSALRSGPFGYQRHKAKLEIIEQSKQFKQNKISP